MSISNSLILKIKLMISRAKMTFLDDTGVRQYIQLRALKGENKNKVERVLDYGIISNPLSGAQGIMLSVGGSRSHPIVLGLNNPELRPKDGEAGEAGSWHYEGHKVRLLQGGIVQIECNQILVKASEKVRFETPEFEVTGEIKDLCDINDQSMSGMREVYNIHTHNENNTSGATDDPNQKMGE